MRWPSSGSAAPRSTSSTASRISRLTRGGTLRTLPNVILTPHVGSTTPEANRGMAERAVQNIVLAEAGEFAQMDLLNPEVVG